MTFVPVALLVDFLPVAILIEPRRGRQLAILVLLFIAACAQIQFFFPCLGGYTLLTQPSASYCVANADVASVGGCAAPAPSQCSARIPVTMQTYGVMLMGAIAGQSGALATLKHLIFLACRKDPGIAGYAVRSPLRRGLSWLDLLRPKWVKLSCF